MALDQTEINRIIAEVSKGSKFYEVRKAAFCSGSQGLIVASQNEKRKDKDLTERIERLLKHRDEVVKGVDLREYSATVYLVLPQESVLREARGGRGPYGTIKQPIQCNSTAEVGVS